MCHNLYMKTTFVFIFTNSHQNLFCGKKKKKKKEEEKTKRVSNPDNIT